MAELIQVLNTLTWPAAVVLAALVIGFVVIFTGR